MKLTRAHGGWELSHRTKTRYEPNIRGLARWFPWVLSKRPQRRPRSAFLSRMTPCTPRINAEFVRLHHRALRII